MFSKISVFVRAETNNALVETGEHLSPKKAPDKTAPPTKLISIPMLVAKTPQMPPIVAAVPKAVPVSMDTQQFNKNVITKKLAGFIKGYTKQTITEIVPEQRHKAVSTPINKKVIKIFFTVFIPIKQSTKSSRQHNPLCFP